MEHLTLPQSSTALGITKGQYNEKLLYSQDSGLQLKLIELSI
jgi:hypothetical protein